MGPRHHLRLHGLTPTIGIHSFYRVTSGSARPNTKLARRPSTAEELALKPANKIQVLMETRGEGGYGVVAPTPGTHHASGNPWTVLVGSPDTIPTITAEQRDTLYVIAATLDQMPVIKAHEPPPSRSLPAGSTPGTRPGDDYNNKTEWEEILTGWTRVRRIGAGWTWRRPGKTDPGISATTGTASDGVDRLYVFSTSTEFETETPYSKFAAYTLLSHGGDYKAAAKGLTTMGYGGIGGQDPRPSSEGQNRDEWTRTAPLPVFRLAQLPRFPTNVLPEPFRCMVTEVARFTQTDETMAGVTVLAVLAACAGGRVKVEARTGWQEPTNLFTATVARPGERKSAVHAVLTKPLMDAERELAEAAAPAVVKAQTMQEVAKKSAEKAKVTAAGTESGLLRDGALADAVTAALFTESIEVPVTPRIWADDCTPEAATSLLAEQGGRLAIISAEGGIFDIIGGRYSNIPNMDVFLKGHSGDPLRIDRKGRPPELINAPALTVGIMVQPQVLSTVAHNPVMRGRGLLARFLYAFPVSLVGHRQVEPDIVSANVEAAYCAAVRDLAIDLAGRTDPAYMTLTKPALRLLLDLSGRTEVRMRAGADLDSLADWASKLSGAVVRIAGLLHLAEHPSDGWRLPVEESSMAGAVALGEFFTGHAIAAFDAMAADPVTALAARILDVLRNKNLSEFSVRDLRRTHMRQPGSEDIAPALALLMESGWLWFESPPESKGPGRKRSPIYSVHPGLFQRS